MSAKSITVAERDEEEEVRRARTALCEFVKADAQLLAVGSGRLAHHPAQFDGLQAIARGGAQPPQLREDAMLQRIAIDLKVSEI